MFDSHIDLASTARPDHAARGMDAPVTVFLNRQWFEYGVSKLLKAATGQSAVLYMTVRGAGSPAVNRRILGLVGNTLRAGIRSGAVAYLGNAAFAVLLQDTDAWQAAAYARVALDVVGGFTTSQGGEVTLVRACIGGILAGHCRDGEYLLARAVEAGELAWEKPGSKVHLLHAPE